jgi:hypothetical protein
MRRRLTSDTYCRRSNNAAFDQKRSLQSAVSQATIVGVIKLLEREAELAAVRVFARRGGILVVEGRAGVGKTSILEAACIVAKRDGRLVLRARGSDLESDFAFGIARQLVERHCTEATRNERAALFRGPASVARPLLMRNDPSVANQDISFAVVHGLYWLMVNLAARRPILLAVDDAHWSDEASLRWVAYLAARLDGIAASLIVTLRPDEPRSQGRALLAVRAAANTTLRPALLSEQAVAACLRNAGTRPRCHHVRRHLSCHRRQPVLRSGALALPKAPRSSLRSKH